MALLTLAAATLLNGYTVLTLSYVPLAPSRANAERIMAETAASPYLLRTVGRETMNASVEEMVTREGLSGCLTNGQSFRLRGVTFDDRGATGLDPAGRPLRLAWNEMSAIGRPTDARVFGQFPVRNEALDCAQS